MEFETTVGAEASAAGTGADTGAPTSVPPAGELNTDTGTGGTPETIPYSRFKEVNDELATLKGFRPLVEVGYDADSLRQLAEFETSFKTDPVTTWLSIAAQIDGLPREMRDMAQRHLDDPAPGGSRMSASESFGQDDGSSDGGGIPEWARDLNDRLDRLDESDQQRMRREQTAETNRKLDGLMAQWRQIDEQNGLKSPSEKQMLTFIIGHARGAESEEAILNQARAEWLELREDTLGSAIKPGGLGAPLSVPGGGAAAPANVAGEPKTLVEASMRAKARLEEAERQGS